MPLDFLPLPLLFAAPGVASMIVTAAACRFVRVRHRGRLAWILGGRAMALSVQLTLIGAFVGVIASDLLL